MNSEPSRRLVLKSILGAGGLVTTAKLPERWISPIVETAVFPAHAQTSSPDAIEGDIAAPGEEPSSDVPCDNDLRAVLTWTDPVDLDLELRIPGGQRIGPGTTSGSHSISEDVTEAPGGETALIPCGEASNPDNDRYQLFIANSSQITATGVRLEITTPAESVTLNYGSITPSFGIRVAFIDYSADQGGVVEVVASPGSCSS